MIVNTNIPSICAYSILFQWGQTNLTAAPGTPISQNEDGSSSSTNQDTTGSSPNDGYGVSPWVFSFFCAWWCFPSMRYESLLPLSRFDEDSSLISIRKTLRSFLVVNCSPADLNFRFSRPNRIAVDGVTSVESLLSNATNLFPWNNLRAPGLRAWAWWFV